MAYYIGLSPQKPGFDSPYPRHLITFVVIILFVVSCIPNLPVEPEASADVTLDLVENTYNNGTTKPWENIIALEMPEGDTLTLVVNLNADGSCKIDPTL